MKRLLVLALLASGGANAGTVYRDRPVPFPVPAGAVCFVKFSGNNINAAHIRDISVDTRTESVRVGGTFSGEWQSRSYNSLRVTYAGGEYTELRGDKPALKVQEEALLQTIKDCDASVRQIRR